MESRRLLSTNIAEFPLRAEGGDPQGIASGAGSDRNVWFTLSSNNIGMIDPNNTSAGVTQYPIPTYNSGAGPIAAGPDGNYWFFEETADQFGVINPSTGSITEIPLLSISNAQVEGITAGPNGYVWFTASGTTSDIGAINTANDQITLFPTKTSGAEPYGIVEGPDGNIWFTEAGTNKIGMINPTTHAMQEFTIDSSGSDQAEGITVGPDNNLWFTLTGTNEIGVINPSTGAVNEFGGLMSNAKPNAITTGSDGNLWFTESGTYYVGTVNTAGKLLKESDIYPGRPVGITSGSDNNLWSIATNYDGVRSIIPGSYKSTSYQYTNTSSDGPNGITSDSIGDLWFTQASDNQVGEFDPTTGITTEIASPTSDSRPLGIALGGDGDIYYTESGYYANGIGWVDPSNGMIKDEATPTANSEPYGMVSDPSDGNLWFTEYSADQIGRIDPTTKAVSEYKITTTNAEPEAITVDASGNIWFVEYNAKRIGELSPNNPNNITEYDVDGTPAGIIAGPDGNIWITEYHSGYYIDVIDPSSGSTIDSYKLGSGNEATSIIVGPDGNLWFADPTGKIGTITTAGVISEYPVAEADPVGITSGNDGNIWFTGTGTYHSNPSGYYPNSIGVVTLSSASIPTQLAVTTQPPGGVTAGAGFGLVVSVENSLGDPDIDYTGSVTIALSNNPGGDTLKGALTATVNDGVAVFSGLTLEDAASGYTITATATGLSSATTIDFNVTLAATQLEVTTEPPSSVLAGTPFGLAVSAEDGQGNVDTTYNGPITLTLGNQPSGAVLSGVLTVGANDGLATFTGLSLNVPFNDYTILASSGTLTAATTNGFDVTAGPASQLVVAAGGEPPSSILAGGTFSLTFDAEDQYGDLATGFDGSVTVAISNNSDVFLQGNLTEDADGGVVTFSGLSIDTVGSYTIQATSSGLTAATTSAVNVTAGQAVQLVISTANQPPSTIAAGGSFGFVVDAEDAFNNIDPTFNQGVTIALVNGSGVILHGALTETAQSGVATFSSLSIDTAGTYTIQATSGSLVPVTTNQITVTPLAASGLYVSAQPPSTITAGDTFALSVGAEDKYGNPIGTFTGSVTIALANNPGVTLYGTLTETAQGGVATFSGLSINTAGTYTIQATSSGLTNATTNSIVVTPQTTATQLMIHAQPSPNATAGMAFATQPVIYEEDQYGNLETGDNSTQVTVTLGSGIGPLQGTTTVTLSRGIATFSNLADDLAETITLTFAGGGLPAVTSNSVTVAAGVAASLKTRPPSGVVAGVAFSMEVDAYDSYGNPATSFNSAVTAALASGSGGNLSGTLTVNADNGVANFSNLISTMSGSISLTASSGSNLSSPPTPSIPVTPAEPSKLLINTQPPPTTTAGAAFSPQPQIYEVDQYGNLESTDNSTVITAALASGAGPLQGTTTATVVGGIATFSDLADDKAETIKLSFSSGILTPATSSSIVVSPAAPTQLVITKSSSSTATAGAPFSIQPVVAEEDMYGNIIKSDSTSTVTAARGDVGTASLQGNNLTLTLVKGVATFGGLSYDKAEAMDISFSTNAIGVSSVTSGTIAVSPAATSQLIIVTQPSPTATAGQKFATQPVIDEEDQYDNIETSDNSTVVTVSLATGVGPLQGTVQATVSDGVATFTNLADNLAETISLNFNGGGLSAGPSNDIVVSPGRAVHLVISPASPPPSTIPVGGTFSFVVDAEDNYGNTDPTYNNDVTVGLTGGSVIVNGSSTLAAQSGVATFTGLSIDTGGNYTLQVTSGTLTPATSGLDVEAPTATTLVLTSQPTTTVSAGTGFGLDLEVLDQFGKLAGLYTGSVTVTVVGDPGGATLSTAYNTAINGGVITLSGLTLDTAGDGYTLQITTGGLPSVTTNSFDVTPSAATQLVVSSQPANVVAGEGFGFTVTAEDQFGNVQPSFGGTVTISLSSNPAGDSLDGTLVQAAGAGAANFSGLTLDKAVSGDTIQASATGLSAAVTSAFGVTAAPATKLVVTTPPPSPGIVGGAFDVVIEAQDQFGNVDRSFHGNVTIVVPPSSDGETLSGTLTVQAVAGVATFTGLTLNQPTSGYELQVSSSGLTTATTATTPVVTPPPSSNTSSAPAPTITGDSIVTQQKKNKKGKPTGKPTFVGFKLTYSSAMNASTAALVANYQMAANVTKHVKKKTVTSHQPVSFTAAYDSSTNSVTLTVLGKQKFTKGGEITVINTPPSGVSDSSGVALSSSDTAFIISPKAKGISLG